MSTGLRELPHGGIAASIFSRTDEMSAIFIFMREQASVDIMAGPPALETMARPPRGSGCFEKAVA